MSGKVFGPYDVNRRLHGCDLPDLSDSSPRPGRLGRCGVPGDVVRELYVVREGQGAGASGGGADGGAEAGGGSEVGDGFGAGEGAAFPEGAVLRDGPVLGEGSVLGDGVVFVEGGESADGVETVAVGVLADGPGGSGPGGGGHGEGPDGGSGGGSGGFGGFGGGLGDEDGLRRLLQARVGDLDPAPDALQRLRRAVPARRQRRRHVVVGAAAALLLGGTSIPAMVHVAHLNDPAEDRSANAASSTQAQDGSGSAHGEGTEHAFPQPTGENGRWPGNGTTEGKDGRSKEKNGADQGTSGAMPSPNETMDVTSPACNRDQLGRGTSSVGPADSSGRVYGAFRVVNTSGTACSIDGGGTVGVVAQGSTNPDRIHVVDHTSGDEATGLPDPATTPDQLVLKPGEAYEVKFAWIPEAGGGPTGCAHPAPSPTPDPSKAPAASPDSGTTTTDGSGSSQTGSTDGTGGSDGGNTASGGVVLSHTPEAGEPAATDAKLADACAGTVYRTEALAAK